MSKWKIAGLILLTIIINCIITISLTNNNLHSVLIAVNQNYSNILIILITLIYTIFNSLMFFETNRARKREESPEITLTFKKYGHNYINMQIKNISHVPAYDIEFIVFPDVIISSADGKRSLNTKELDIIQKGIKYMGPTQVYDFYYVILDALKDEERMRCIDFVIKYKDRNKKSFETKITSDFSVLQYIELDYLSELTDAIKGISSKMDR